MLSCRKIKMSAPSEFSESVIKIIKKIPRGKIATYAQVAKLAGKPRAVRGVVWILHSSSNKHDLPWHRVINSKGRISFPEMSESWLRQKSLLEKEKIEFGEGGLVDLKRFAWEP